MVGLQKLLYGPLRVIEIEQLYEKAWFAITETCLAMTIFREEVGFWFFVMFVSLLIGKVWAWIGEGRVEILEQQPPANPRLFHFRLSSSLLLSTAFAFYMLNHSVQTVREQAEPNMMVMFAFEFAVLTVTSLSTALRYTISLREMAIIKEQTKIRLQERQARILRDQEEARQNAAGPGNTHISDVGSSSAEINPDFEEDDVEVPGWEDKGRWIFYLDLATGLCMKKAGLCAKLISNAQISSSWFCICRSFVSYLPSMECPYTSYVMWQLLFDLSINASMTLCVIDRPLGT